MFVTTLVDTRQVRTCFKIDVSWVDKNEHKVFKITEFFHIMETIGWLPCFIKGICLIVRDCEFCFFFYVGTLTEDIFSGHLLSPLFQSTLQITITSLCLCVDTVRFSCLLLCAQNLFL